MLLRSHIEMSIDHSKCIKFCFFFYYFQLFKWNFQILSTIDKATDFFLKNILLGCRYRKRFLPKSVDRGDSGSETWVYYYVFEYMCEQIECTLQFICLYRSGHCGWVPVVYTYLLSFIVLAYMQNVCNVCTTGCAILLISTFSLLNNNHI